MLLFSFVFLYNLSLTYFGEEPPRAHQKSNINLCLLQVSNTLTRLEGVNNFTEFVKAFSQFGSEMVDFAHVTGDRQNDLKDERRRAQMSAARTILERSTLMLLTASKVFFFSIDNSKQFFLRIAGLGLLAYILALCPRPKKSPCRDWIVVANQNCFCAGR